MTVRTVHIDERGRGAPVAFLHGTPTTVDVFAPLVEALETTHRTLVVHLPGYGASAPLDGPYDLARARVAVEDALLQHDAAGAILIGFSGGAYRALDIAVAGRVRPARLVCLAGFASLDEAEAAGMRQFVAALRAGVDLRPIAPGRFLSAGFAAAHPEACAAVTRWVDATSPALLADELEAFNSAPPLLPRLGALAIPLLARTGELDVAAPPAKAEALARAVPGALLEIAPGAGHALLLEDTEATIASVRRFITS